MTVMYFAQGFRSKGRSFEPDPPQSASTAEAAIAAAERLGAMRTGAWAYAANIDQQTDTYDQPQELFRTGTLPEGLASRPAYRSRAFLTALSVDPTTPAS